MIWSLNNQNRTDDIKGKLLCMMMILMRMRRMVCLVRKGPWGESKLYIMYKLVMLFDYNVEQAE